MAKNLCWYLSFLVNTLETLCIVSSKSSNELYRAYSKEKNGKFGPISVFYIKCRSEFNSKYSILFNSLFNFFHNSLYILSMSNLVSFGQCEEY